MQFYFLMLIFVHIERANSIQFYYGIVTQTIRLSCAIDWRIVEQWHGRFTFKSLVLWLFM